MKKVIALILALVMAVSMIACGEQQSAETEKTPLAGTMEENVNKIMEACPVEFMGGFMPVDLSDTSEEGAWAVNYYTGLQSGEKLTDIAVYEPMMGSQAFSLVMVRVADAADAQAIGQEMFDNIDTRKWICVGADQVLVAGYSDVVMLIMLDTQLGLEPSSYLDAFLEICGNVDFTILQ